MAFSCCALLCHVGIELRGQMSHSLCAGIALVSRGCRAVYTSTRLAQMASINAATGARRYNLPIKSCRSLPHLLARKTNSRGQSNLQQRSFPGRREGMHMGFVSVAGRCEVQSLSGNCLCC